MTPMPEAHEPQAIMSAQEQEERLLAMTQQLQESLATRYPGIPDPIQSLLVHCYTRLYIAHTAFKEAGGTFTPTTFYDDYHTPIMPGDREGSNPLLQAFRDAQNELNGIQRVVNAHGKSMYYIARTQEGEIVVDRVDKHQDTKSPLEEYLDYRTLHALCDVYDTTLQGIVIESTQTNPKEED